jgi:asparagine synthase (glutamine-hydrolysing)
MEVVKTARLVARSLGTDHHEHVVTPQAADVLGRIAWHFDEPLADSSALPTWYVCQMARQSVTVALSGDGGDESFAGYTFRYQPHVWESHVRAMLPAALRGMVFGTLGATWPDSARLPRPLRLKTFLGNLAVGDMEAFSRDLAWLRPQDRQRLYAPGLRDALRGFTPTEAVAVHYLHNDAPDALARAQYTDVNVYMTDDVLVKVDRMSMAHALEVRSPLLDHRLLEFAATLPADHKLDGSRGKRLLRAAAARRLPAELLSAPKRGFSIPAAQWLRGGLRDLAAGAIFDDGSPCSELLDAPAVRRTWEEHQLGSRDHSVLLWGLMMLGLWKQQRGRQHA